MAYIITLNLKSHLILRGKRNYDNLLSCEKKTKLFLNPVFNFFLDFHYLCKIVMVLKTRWFVIKCEKHLMAGKLY